MLAKERASGACHMCQRSGCAAGAGTAHGAERQHRMILGFGLARLMLVQTSTSPARDFGCQPFFFIGSLFWMFPLLNNFIQPKQTTSSLEKKGKHTKGTATTLMYVCPSTK